MLYVLLAHAVMIKPTRRGFGERERGLDWERLKREGVTGLFFVELFFVELLYYYKKLEHFRGFFAN
jgi:hypothetical protein